MKIAIPMAGGQFSEHFGGAREFLVFEADRHAGSVGAGALFPAPEHKPGWLPEWLATQKMDAVIASAIGERALLMLADAGIETYLSGGESEPSKLATACLLEKLPRANQENSRCNGAHHDHDGHTEKATDALEELHRDCFACGVCNHSGLNLHFDVGAGGVATAVWQPSAAFRSYPDRVHGGVIATLLDSAIVHALFARGVSGVTAELTIRYLQSVNVTDPVHVTGWVESNRHGVYLCCAEVHQAGLLAVRASAKFMAMPDASPLVTE